MIYYYNKRTCILALFTFALFFSDFILAQQISGRVKHGLDLSPVDSIEVCLLRNGMEYKAITNEAGEYTLVITNVQEPDNITPIKLYSEIQGNSIVHNALDARVKFFNSNGEEITSVNHSNGNVTIPSNVSSGLYFYQIISEAGTLSGKYIIADGQIVAKSVVRNTSSYIDSKLSKVTIETVLIKFTDLRIPKMFHDYVDSQSAHHWFFPYDLDTVTSYNCIAWPILKLAVPFETIKTVLDMARYFTGGSVYTCGRLRLPIQFYIDGSETTKEIAQLWIPIIKAYHDTMNLLLGREVFKFSERLYGWDYWDREYSGMHVRLINNRNTYPLSAAAGWTTIVAGAAGQMNMIIYRNTTYYQDEKSIKSGQGHEAVHRGLNLSGPPDNFGIPPQYSAAVASDTRTAIYPNKDEIAALKIQLNINDLKQIIKINYYQKAK